MSNPLPKTPIYRLDQIIPDSHALGASAGTFHEPLSKEPGEQRKKAGKKIPPRTDFGTIALHWCFAVAFTWVLLTGMRVASDNDNLDWLRNLDGILPANQLWSDHVLGATILTATALGYVVYISMAKLFARIRLGGSRISSAVSSRKARWGAMNVFLYWMFFISCIGCLITGWMLYFGFGGIVLLVHLHSIWTMAAFPLLHVIVQLRIGGLAQLTRILRPSKLQRAAPAPDLAGLVSDLLAQQAKGRLTDEHQDERRKHG